MIHGIRLGTHAEKEYLVRAAPWFDEVFLTANLVEATAGATGAFLLALNKPYNIDPITYSFGQDPHYLANAKRGEMKRTFRALADRYAGPVSAYGKSGAPLFPDDFAEPASVHTFCQNVVEYQQSRIAEALAANELFLESTPGQFPPQRVLAPYFFVDVTLSWLSRNVELAEASVGRSDGIETWAVLAFDATLLDRGEEIDRLIEAYVRIPCSGFFLWPSAFNETRATIGQVVGLRRLVRSLCADGRGAFMLYGGYLSALLRDEGVIGVCHGIGYGEKRDVVPVVGGGLPPARYYLRAIHDFISMDELLRIADGLDVAEFREAICDCTICSALLQRGDVASLRSEFRQAEQRPYGSGIRAVSTSRVYRLARFHYLENKHREIQEAATLSRDTLIVGLDERYKRFSPHFGSGRLGYLVQWKRALVEAA